MRNKYFYLTIASVVVAGFIPAIGVFNLGLGEDLLSQTILENNPQARITVEDQSPDNFNIETAEQVDAIVTQQLDNLDEKELETESFMTSSVIVEYEDNYDLFALQDNIVEVTGLSEEEVGSNMIETKENIMILNLGDKNTALDVVKSVRSNGVVKNIQPIYNYKTFYTPTNDPQWPNQWYYADQVSGVGAESGWDNLGASKGVACGESASGLQCGGDSGVKIAVIDTGVNTQAADFAGINVDSSNSMRFYNNSNNTCQPGTYYVGFENNTPPPAVINFCQDIGSQFDEQGHGTGVASVIYAQDNSIGAVGLAHNTTLLPIAVHGDAFNTYFIAEAVSYAADNGADVINLSLGTPFFDSYLQSAINDAVNDGVLVVAASGNCAVWSSSCDWDGNGSQTPGFFAEEDNAIMYPAGFGSVVAAGASNYAATEAGIDRAYYSNYGSHIDLVAPVGDGSTIPSGTQILCGVVRSGCSSVDTYKQGFGTSYAAPQVAAAAGLLLSQDPGLTVTEVRNALEDNALDIGSTGFDNDFGNGLVKLSNSINDINVSIVDPETNNPVLSTSQDVTVLVSADHSGETITKVDLYDRGQLIDSDTTAPFSFFLDSSSFVPYRFKLTAKAYSTSGVSKVSQEESFIVNYDFTTWESDQNFQTDTAVSLFEHDNDLYQTVVGLNNRIYSRSNSTGLQLQNWSNWVTSSDSLEYTDKPVYGASFNGNLYQVHVGSNKKVFTRYSTDGVTWSGWLFDSRYDEETEYPVTIVEFDGRLYNVMVGLDNRIYTRSSLDGLSWTTWQTGTDPLERTFYTVHTTVFDNRLYQVHVGTNKRIFTRSSLDGVNWSSWTWGGDTSEDTRNPVTIAAAQNKVYETHKGTNEIIFTRSSLDGVNWSGWIPSDEKTNVEIALTQFDGQIYQSYVGKDKYIYVRRLD